MLFMWYHLIMQDRVIKIFKAMIIKNMTQDKIDSTLDSMLKKNREERKKLTGENKIWKKKLMIYFQMYQKI